MNLVAPDPKKKHKLPSPTELERANDLERRRQIGQFFTPVCVAEFMWDFLEIINGGPFPASTRLIDPACGEGVFLRVARERGRLAAGGLLGTDIDPTLAPGLRSDPLLGGAHVHIANGLVDVPTLGIRQGTFDIVAGNPPFSGKGLRELLRLLEEDGEEERHPEQDLFDESCLKEERPAPRQPFSDQERTELDRLVRALSQYACWRQSPALVEDADAASSEDRSQDLLAGLVLNERPRLTATDCERAAHLIGHWPADRLLDVSRPEIRDVILRLASTAIEVFFTERFVRLASPGGLIAVIVPESIVASERLSPLRRWLTGRMELLASVGLPQKVFTGVGANAKTTILFSRRRTHDRPEGWWLEDPDALPDAKRKVLLTAPRLDAPNWSLESYLDSVLESSRKRDNSDSGSDPE